MLFGFYCLLNIKINVPHCLIDFNKSDLILVSLTSTYVYMCANWDVEVIADRLN
jgi:hypothetical protein